MEFNVKLALGPSNWFPTTLTVRQQGAEIFLDFGGRGSDPLFSDRFFSFTHVDFPPDNETIITLSGPSTRSIRFENQTTISNVWVFLQKFVDFAACPDSDNRRFEMHKKRRDYVKPTRSMSVTTSTNRRNQKLEQNSPLKNQIVGGDPFEFVSQSSLKFLEFPLISTTTEEINRISSDGSPLTPSLLPGLSLTEPGYAELFRARLAPKDDSWPTAVSNYENLRKQWKLLTADQWKNASKLRQFVADTEFALDGCHGLGETMKLLVFDALMSHFTLHQRVVFSKSLFNIAVVFVRTYYIGSRGDVMFDRFGNEVPFLEAAAAVFWSFHKYVVMFIEYDNPEFVFPATQFIYTCVAERLDVACPTVSSFLKAHDITSFEFLERDIRESFIGGRSLQDAQFIMACFMIDSEPALLITLFVAALFAELANRFTDTPVPSDRELFIEMILAEISKVNLRLLIYNADALRTYIKARI